VQLEAAAAETQCGRQRPVGRTGETEIEPIRCVASHERPAPALHAPCRASPRDVDAERSQRITHVTRIVGIEQVRDLRDSVGQRGQQECTIRDALRAGQRHVAFDTTHRVQREGLHGRAIKRQKLRPALVFRARNVLAADVDAVHTPDA
jgi:hypothetical protein